MNCAFLSSCRTDELCYDHPHDGNVNVHIIWDDAEDAHCSGVRVWIYDHNGENGYPVDINAAGGYVSMKEGDYRIAAHNNDTEWITYSGEESYSTLTATTRDAHILEPLYEGFNRAEENDPSLLPNPDERVAVAPEPVFGTGTGDIHVAPGDEVTLRVKPLCCTYTVTFVNTGSLAEVAHMSAAITGLSESALIFSGEISSNTVTHPFAVSAGKDDNSITGTFYTYGNHPEVDAEHKVALYLVMKNGKQYKFIDGETLFVGDQIDWVPDPRHVNIEVYGVSVPQENTSGGDNDVNWEISLEGWENQNVEIQM